MHVRNAPRLTWRKSWVAAAVLQALMGSVQAGGVRWELVPIPVVAGLSPFTYDITDINNAGQSVGKVKVNGGWQAFLNTGGSLLWLGNPPSGTERLWEPSAISDPSGVRGTVNIAGDIYDCSTGRCVSPKNFVQTAGTVLGQLGSVQTLSFPGTTESRITAINQGGVMAGNYVVGGTRLAAFAGSLAEGFIPLQTLSSSDGHAWAINNAGIVAGWVSNTNPNEGAAIWNARTGNVQYIGTLGGLSSQAFSINEQGTVVGRASVGFVHGVERLEAFIYRNGVMSRIAANLSSAGSGSVATSINNRGQTLGSFLKTVNGVDGVHSFIHTASGGAVSLQGLGLQYPGGKMNDLGQILQSSTLHNPTGTLTWAQSTGGSVGVADNWDSGIGFAPNQFFDVVITTARDQTISGDASFVAKSLRIDGSPSGQGTLALSNGAAVYALNGVTVGARGRLQGAGSVVGLGVINRGVVNALPGQLLVLEGGLDNRGVVTGNGRIEADLINRGGGAGGVQVGAGQNLTLAGTVHSLSDGSRVRVRDGGSLAFEGRVINQGGATLEIQRGVLQVGYGVNRMQSAGLVLVGSGRAELLGDVTNGPRGLIHATEGADLTVWDGLVKDRKSTRLNSSHG